MKRVVLILLLIVISVHANAEDTLQTFLSIKSTGVADFLAKYPKYDGRGTIVFIFDTGVDMGVDGLQKNSLGETKFIDVQDFTGQGDLPFNEASVDGDIVRLDKLQLKGISKLSYKSVDGKYYLGCFEESKMKNSGSGLFDINGNGKKDDVFQFVCFKTQMNGSDVWVAYFDTNLNGEVSDEQPLMNYSIKFDSFNFNPKTSNLTFALNVFPNEGKITLHYDDGSHGTHCAGISTGYRIGNSNLNGVAIGANVISLKIGDNSLSGGSTVTLSMKRAFEYASKYAKEKQIPCVINMSYGTSSVIEGQSDIERYIGKLLLDNPYLYVCTSNGNEGPGISTAGLPSSCRYILSSGAVMSKEVGNDVYGTVLNKDIILHFSSRGGEVSKPDIVSPGACTSTVPEWQLRDVMWGTSMASPYTAGVCALVLSAMKSEFPNVKIPSKLLFDAIRNSAQPLSGYTILDQGSGMVNVLAAYNLLKKYIQNGEINKVQNYEINTVSLNLESGIANNLYLRNGNAIDPNDVYSFTVRRAGNLDSKFFRTYKLKSDASFIKLVQNKIYLRNDQSATVSLKIDKSELKESGLYTGKITAYRDDKSLFPEFSMLATVIIPEEFTKTNDYRISLDKQLIAPGEHKRIFFNVTNNISSIKIRVASIAGKYSNLVYRLYNNDGDKIYTSKSLYTKNDRSEMYNTMDNLTPGVYELVVHGSYMAADKSAYNLDIEAVGIKVINKRITDNDITFELNNSFNKHSKESVEGSILGYQNEFNTKIDKEDTFVYEFKFEKNISYKEFQITMEKEDYNKFTDFALGIYDSKGSVLEKEGLNFVNGTIGLKKEREDTSIYKLVLKGGYAIEPVKVKLKILEKSVFAKNINLVQIKPRTSVQLLSANDIKKVTFTFEKLPEIPQKAKYYGIIRLKNADNIKESDQNFIINQNEF